MKLDFGKVAFLLSVGVAVVGVGDLLFEDQEALNAILGDAFALSAMIFWAAQLTYEEKFVKKHNIKPMHALGLKGIFSLIILTSMLLGFYFLKVPFDMGQPNGVMEDAIDGFLQLGNNIQLLLSYICKLSLHFSKGYIQNSTLFSATTLILVISALAGIGVMRKLSAVHVVVFNTSRSVIVWAFSLAVSWQKFQALQVVGFVFIILGVMVFNDILIGKTLLQ